MHVVWILVACAIACVGIGWALDAAPEGQSSVGAGFFVRYMAVVLALAVVSFGLHRRARETAVDVVVIAIAGPVVFGVILVVTTIHDCSFGAGC